MIFRLNKKRVILATPIILVAAIATYLLIPPDYQQLRPAGFDLITENDSNGQLIPLELAPANIFGLGLTYSSHIKETASPYNPKSPPVIFRKEVRALQDAATVKIPSNKDVLTAIDTVEPGLGQKIEKKFDRLPLLLDYEVELAFVLLEEVDWPRMNDPEYAPKLGYFIANDLSARSIAVLGEGQTNRYDYWGASKSFPGFLPVGKVMYVPDHQHANSVFATTLTTKVNGQLRQQQSTTDMIYTPKQMLHFIAKKYPNNRPQKGDIVLTGTPGGVAIQIPAWKAKLGRLLQLNRFIKLASILRSNTDNPDFLSPGDQITISGGILGQIQTQLIE
jgi:2-keto-4-pentenoate hydratase/2-oxohepta-3-ene-1,7-dioic acid hydratase in catechol pathway